MLIKDILNNEYEIIEEYRDNDSYSLSTLIRLTQEKEYERFLSVLNHLQVKKLYKSDHGNLIHGQNHIERVLFMANLLSIFYDLNEREYKIVMDGASYHDIGRTGDKEDTVHGLSSANNIDKIIKNDPFYQDKENLNILKAIINFHAREDDTLEDTAIFHDVTDYELYKKLAFILKDADALDRVRFLSTDSAYINPDYLRTPMSKKMIVAAKNLVNIYLYPKLNKYVKTHEVKVQEEKIKVSSLHDNDEVNKYGCMHGIGWDFFKLENILLNGILSPRCCEKNHILTSKNFDLSHCKDYIHVIPDINIEEEINSAYRHFITKGISFYAIVPKIMEGLPYTREEEAIERNLPCTRGEYSDEAFVRDKIELDSIEYVLFVKEYKDLRLDQLSYFDCNISPKIMSEKASYYVRCLRDKLGYEVNSTEIDLISSIYKDVFIASQRREDNENLNSKIEYIKDKMNKKIGGYMQEAYSNVLGEEATVSKVVEHIVSKTRDKYQITKGEEVMLKVK